MLALAAAFNERNGADYLHFQLGKRQATGDAWPLTQSSQYAGMRDQAVRSLMGIIHEILVLLKEHATVTDAALVGEGQGVLGHLRARADMVGV